MSRRDVGGAWLAGAAVLAGAFLLPRVGFAWQAADGNLTLFSGYGHAIADGGVPYRDVRLEYPPGALVPIVVPALLGIPYAAAFELFAGLTAAAAVGAVAAALAWRGVSRAAVYGGAVFVALALAAAGRIVLQRYDLLPALLVLAALLLASSRPRLAAAALGVGTLLKLYPAVLLPLLCLHLWRRGRSRDARAAAVVFALVVAVPLLAFALVDRGGLYNAFAGQANRHLQLESIGASALLAAHELGSFRPRIVFDAGAYTLTGRTADGVARAHTALVALALLAVYLRFARVRRPGTVELTAAAAAAVAAFALLGKVLSPQFLLWLVPLVPLLAPAAAVAAGAVLLAALAASSLLYPTWYDRLLDLEPSAVWLLVGRNVLLVALFALLLVPLRRASSFPASRRASRARRPAERPAAPPPRA